MLYGRTFKCSGNTHSSDIKKTYEIVKQPTQWYGVIEKCCFLPLKPFRYAILSMTLVNSRHLYRFVISDKDLHRSIKNEMKHTRCTKTV